MPRRSPRLLVGPILAALALPVMGAMADHASWEPLGYNDLIARLGGIAPDGTGVLVAEVEPTDGEGDYGPNQGGNQYNGKTFHEMSGPTGTSDHAHTVGKYQYGNGWSVANGVTDVWLWEAADWVFAGYLRVGAGSGTPPEPMPSAIKCLNNSWIATFGSTATDNEALRRLDWAIDRDGLFVTNGVNNDGGPAYPLLSHAFNAISVGIQAGTHTADATGPGYDGPGRMKPEIVAPEDYSSFATPMVNACGAVLVETARTNPMLSSDPAAERPEVLKAVLMAGAVHEDLGDGVWSNEPVTGGRDRGLAVQPIDAVVGAGTANIDRAHRILTAGRQPGSLVAPASPNAEWAGWDLAGVPAGESRFWRFHLPAAAPEISILATWNRRVRTTFGGYFFADFDLRLWRVSDDGSLLDLLGDPGFYFQGGNVVSASAVDNVEHLHVTTLLPGSYVVELARVDSLGIPPVEWDVAIAWLLPEPASVPEDIDGDGIVGFTDLVLVLAGWGNCLGCPEDVTGDGTVGFDDLVAVLAAWSM